MRDLDPPCLPLRTWLIVPLTALHLGWVGIPWVAAASATGSSQETLPFRPELVEVVWPGAPTLQSFAVGQTTDGRWLVVGGRTTGLHGDQDPGDLPDPATNFKMPNECFWVLDPLTRTQWSARVDALLSAAEAEALTVTNAQFTQVGDKLYIVGGYGSLTDSGGIHSDVTFGRVTIIDVDATADAIVNSLPLNGHVRHADGLDFLRVTGGEMVHHNGVFYLVFGHCFAGNYSSQANGEYTYQVRTFTVDDGVVPPAVTQQAAFGSAVTNPSFRRRDLNLLQTREPGGAPTFTVYGGVFTAGNGPWYQPIYITPAAGATTLLVDPSFQQQMCHYNCAAVTLWSDSTAALYSVFFGGISEVFYRTSGGRSSFQRDVRVPFIDEVACIRRDPDGTSQEFLLLQPSGDPLRLPALLGANARFIKNASLAAFDGELLELDQLAVGTTLIGHIYGGIRANQPNNNFGVSMASNKMSCIQALCCVFAAGALAGSSKPDDFLPRIHFQGHFVANPGTGNNDGVLAVITDPSSAELTSGFQGMTDADVRTFMMQTQLIGGRIYLNSGWNWYGDMSVYFKDVQVTSVRRKDGAISTNDPVVGKYVNIVGENGNLPVMTDSNPTVAVAPQLFVGGLTIGDNPTAQERSPSPAAPVLSALHNTRGFARWVGNRNWGMYTGEHGFPTLSATWQFAIPPAALPDPTSSSGRVEGARAETDSVLDDLLAAAKQAEGLLVQFTIYQMEPEMCDFQLAARFSVGDYVANPATGFMVGTILVRQKEEFKTVINGRRLEPPPPPPDGNGKTLGMAAATVDTTHEVVTLNLMNGIPEQGYVPPADTAKVDLGPLTFGVLPRGKILPTQAKTIGVMYHDPTPGAHSYGYESYRTTGGQLDFDLGDSPDGVTLEDLAEGRLIVYDGMFAARLLESYIQIQTDDLGVYFSGPNETQTIELVVSGPGARESAGSGALLVQFWEFQGIVVPGNSGTRTTYNLCEVQSAGVLPHLSFQPRMLVRPGQRTSFEITSSSSSWGSSHVVMSTGRFPPPSGSDFPIKTAFFSSTRVMPFDDFSSYSMAERTSWGFVYEHVFRYYYLIYPGMAEQIIPFNSQTIMEHTARRLVSRLGRTPRLGEAPSAETDLWFSSLNMPRTRELSVGKRALLEEWATVVSQ
jgi:hypothetical protein